MPFQWASVFTAASFTATRSQALLAGTARAGSTLAALGAHSLASTFLSPVTRAFHYRANAIGPDVIPPVDSLLGLWFSGRAKEQDIHTLLSRHGIPFDAKGPPGELIKDAWWHIFDLQRPLFALEQYRHWQRQGRISPNTLNIVLDRYGFSDPVQKDLFKSDYNDVGESLVLSLFERGFITEEEARLRLQQLGYLRVRDVNLLLAPYNPPPPAEALILRNRNQISDEQLDEYLYKSGYRRQSERDRIASLRFEIPGPSDLVRFAVREVFAPELAMRYGFDQEMPEDFRTWIDKQGFGTQFEVTDPISGKKYPMDWAKAHWWSHWQWPAPTQAYSMRQRMRATGGPNNGPRDPSGLVFSADDLSALLRGSDYPPHWRPYLESISFRKPDRQDVAYMYTFGQIDREEAAEKYQDAGFGPKDSGDLVTLLDYRIRFRQFQQNIQRAKFRIINAYRIGTIGRSQAASLLYFTTLQNLADINAFIALSQTERNDIALADPYVKIQLDSIDTDVRAKMIAQAIAGIRRNFIALNITDQQALSLLNSLGITQARATDYVNVWKWQLYRKGKQFSAAQIQRFAVRGLLSLTDALSRLTRLGYTVGDAYIILAQIRQDTATAEARREVALAREAEHKQHALIALQKAMRAQLRQVQSDLARHGTPAKLQKWLKLGLIEKDEYERRMAVLGWPQPDIERTEEEIKHHE